MTRKSEFVVVFSEARGMNHIRISVDVSVYYEMKWECLLISRWTFLSSGVFYII